MISYAPIEEIVKRPPQTIIQKLVKDDAKITDENDKIECECYYVTLVFILSLIILLTTDMLKK